MTTPRNWDGRANAWQTPLPFRCRLIWEGVLWATNRHALLPKSPKSTRYVKNRLIRARHPQPYIQARKLFPKPILSQDRFGAVRRNCIKGIFYICDRLYFVIMVHIRTPFPYCNIFQAKRKGGKMPFPNPWIINIHLHSE